ncbi:Ubiquinone biosynthesis O-methyltransferase [uncultured archaeon]|nr:Ubiquinone biosynthesis O-methyltransferase [uncultured archaeon]
MESYRKAWEKDYKSRGRLWGGGLPFLPDLPLDSRVLELGCGNGKTLSAALRYPWSLTALDTSDEAVRLGRIAAQEKADLLVADACLLPFRELAFDAVFAFHVVGHVLHADRETMAAEATRVLKFGGKLFLRDFGMEDMRIGIGEEVEPGTFRRGQGVTTHYFTEDEAENLFSLMEPVTILTHKWKMRVRGKDLLRSEVEAVFQKVS